MIRVKTIISWFLVVFVLIQSILATYAAITSQYYKSLWSIGWIGIGTLIIAILTRE